MNLIHGGRRLMAVGVLSLAALAFVGSAAAASPAVAGQAPATGPAKFTVDTAPLVLSHDGTHYTGDLRVTVRNVGGEASENTMMELGLPAGLRFNSSDGVCTFGEARVYCAMFGGIEPGARKTYTLSFGSWAAPSARARITSVADLTVTPDGEGATGAASDTYAGILKSTTGSIRHPRPYAPSTVARTQLTAGPAAIRELPGTAGTREFEVRIPVTVRAGNDIPNDFGVVRIAKPEGTSLPHTEPSAVCTLDCEVPGDWMAAGETRTFDIVFTYNPATLPVDEKVTLEGVMNHGGLIQPEATPARNTATVPLTIAA
ncbi:hypothetical protein [Virgisporangium aurantiacum]|nr:hypothetical protein [Virgisporangium aurantiacum]